MTSKLDGLVHVGAFIVIWFRDGSMNIKVFNLVGCQSTLKSLRRQSTLKSFCQPARLKTLRFHDLTRSFRLAPILCKWKWNSPLKLDGLVQLKVTGMSLCQIASCFVQAEVEQSIEIGRVSPG